MIWAGSLLYRYLVANMLSSGIDHIYTGEVCIYIGLVWPSVFVRARQSTRSTSAARISSPRFDGLIACAISHSLRFNYAACTFNHTIVVGFDDQLSNSELDATMNLA